MLDAAAQGWRGTIWERKGKEGGRRKERGARREERERGRQEEREGDGEGGDWGRAEEREQKERVRGRESAEAMGSGRQSPWAQERPAYIPFNQNTHQPYTF